ncbi:MAG: TetR family transcriptional regulator [Lachnospiraceae bacterium]|nr:TetR family transcriptional regulator [Lachnospiraceae bacterium]
MTRKEEIIFATLELASTYGLRAISLSQIAERVGIKKPSLYNHFKSKDEIVSAMYSFLRERANTGNSAPSGFEDMFSSRSLEEILLGSVTAYLGIVSDKHMLQFFKVLYSERSTNPIAAQIMLEETDCMLQSSKNMFYALVVHGKGFKDAIDSVEKTS